MKPITEGKEASDRESMKKAWKYEISKEKDS